MQKKSLRVIGWLLKIAIVFLAFYYIYHQLFEERNMRQLFTEFRQLVRWNELPGILLVVFLMLFNWSLEAAKWRYLVKKIEDISFGKALVAVFSGITVSVFTPNKIGEYGGRVFHLKSEHRLDAVVITLVGSMMQLGVTLLGGLITAPFFYAKYHKGDDYVQEYFFYGLLFVTFSFLGVLALAFFRRMLLKKALHRMGFLERARKYGKALTFYHRRELWFVFRMCLARYVVFSTQLYLLLWTFDVYLSFIQALLFIPLIFFMITVIPRPLAFAELGVRASTALYFLTYLNADQTGVLLAMFSLWMLNLAVPALLGSIFILRMRIFGR
ncbi:MAG: flippase-like domain-containing protein [Flavobacteriales bacterium]|nr:flippase-like domain-containing protein [Flavobacteriales bacterium]MCB9448427.1 flippase-like domain-containing protein [Flavobacteriales bacterium]